MVQTPAEKENQGNMIAANISSDAARTGHREWNIVLFLALAPKKKAVKVKIQFYKVCLSHWDQCSVLKDLFIVTVLKKKTQKTSPFGLSSQGLKYNKQNNIPENWCGLR